ncbi:MAG: hypothetical protein JW749_09495 [Sedimentisphaerales bacterium]|nr:hypothetical protein [Sedimentisphaerales bacterium]
MNYDFKSEDKGRDVKSETANPKQITMSKKNQNSKREKPVFAERWRLNSAVTSLFTRTYGVM